MAVYHFTAKAVSMGKGQSAVHTAAYNARCVLIHERESRLTKNYDYKGTPEFSGIFAPKDAPAWALDREQLWNRAEAAERQANGQPARNIEFALPHELTADQRRHLVTDFVRETFARRGMIADVNIHSPHPEDDPRNYHVHCLLTMRRLDGDEFAKTKERQWNAKAELEQWREKWAHMGARALERSGFEIEAARFREGHKTLSAQRDAALERGDMEWAEHCDREAGIHKGPAVTAMEKRHDPRLKGNDIAETARGIVERNAARAEIRAIERELAAVRQAAPELKGPAADIRLAWSLSDSGPAFAAALEARGLVLARVSADEAVQSERAHAFAREVGNFAPRYREGELVALTDRGHVYQITPKITGADRAEIDKRLASIDGESMLSVADTRDSIREASRLVFAEQKQRERPATKIEALIQSELRHAQTPQAFTAALYQEGITVARVDTKGREQVQREYDNRYIDQRIEARGKDGADLEATKHRDVKFVDGELVAVDRYANVHRLNPHQVNPATLEAALTHGTHGVPNLSGVRDFIKQDREAGRKANQQHRQERINESARTRAERQEQAHADWQQRAQDQRARRSDNPLDRAQVAAKDAIDNPLGTVTNAAGRALDNGLGAVPVAKLGLRVFDATSGVTNFLSNVVDALLGGGPKIPTRMSEQIIAQRRALAAMENIRDDIEAGRNLRASDIAALTPDHLQSIKAKGDAYVLELIQSMERRRERDRDYERSRER